MILIAKVLGFVVYTLGIWYVGNKWATLNSVSDIETVYNNVKTSVAAEIAKVEADIAAATAKLASLKALV